MNWHRRYSQQASWTRELRNYVFTKTELDKMQRVLEVGCGTGAILSELPDGPRPFGLDIDRGSLLECRLHAPQSILTEGSALDLPYFDASYDLVYSHFLLLWVRDPVQALQEMKRVTRPGGYVAAFAEPDYSQRVDRPAALIPLGQWQTKSLLRQGADPTLGAGLAELFFQAGVRIIETGTIQSQEQQASLDDWQIEWEVLESDLQGSVARSDIQRMKERDLEARKMGTRLLKVPTYFAWGRVE